MIPQKAEEYALRVAYSNVFIAFIQNNKQDETGGLNNKITSTMQSRVQPSKKTRRERG
jgi:hypothetical protein